MQVKWLYNALSNLDEGATYTAGDDERAARLVVQRILRHSPCWLSRLAWTPGQPPGTRELVAPKIRHIVPYRVRNRPSRLCVCFTRRAALPWAGSPSLHRRLIAPTFFRLMEGKRQDPESETRSQCLHSAGTKRCGLGVLHVQLASAPDVPGFRTVGSSRISTSAALASIFATSTPAVQVNEATRLLAVGALTTLTALQTSAPILPPLLAIFSAICGLAAAMRARPSVTRARMV